MTCLSNNWKFVPFDLFHLFTYSPPLFLLTSSLFSVSMSSVFCFCFFFQIPRTGEILQYVFFGKLSIQILCPFFNWICFVSVVCLLLNCMSYLYIFHIKPFLATLFASIFSIMNIMLSFLFS